MGEIIWLASYPKSGNTWLRAFLANLFIDAEEPVDINDLINFGTGDTRAYLYERAAGEGARFEDMTDEQLHKLRPKVHGLIAATRPDTVFAKTHNMIKTLAGVPTITPSFTAGAIYVSRNPCDVTISYAHHYGITPDEAIEAMNSEVNRIVSANRGTFQHLGTWSEHVNSWMTAPGLTRYLIRYEDMVRDPLRSFAGVVRFLGVPCTQARLEKAVRFSSFKVLAAQELDHGFIEQSANNEQFFRKGVIGDFRNELSFKQIRQIVGNHGAVMKKLGYLDDKGEVRV